MFEINKGKSISWPMVQNYTHNNLSALNSNQQPLCFEPAGQPLYRVVFSILTDMHMKQVIRHKCCLFFKCVLFHVFFLPSPSFVLVKTWGGDSSSKGSHCCWLPPHWRSIHLPEWRGGGRRCPGHDKGGRGQTGGAFHREQGQCLRCECSWGEKTVVLVFLGFFYNSCLFFLAVEHVPSEVLGQTGLWEDSQRSKTGLLRPLPDPLAHGLHGMGQHK